MIIKRSELEKSVHDTLIELLEKIETEKYKNEPYIQYSKEAPYPSELTESGLVSLLGETWKFYAREKSMGDAKWGMVNRNNEIIWLPYSNFETLKTMEVMKPVKSEQETKMENTNESIKIDPEVQALLGVNESVEPKTEEKEEEITSTVQGYDTSGFRDVINGIKELAEWGPNALKNATSLAQLYSAFAAIEVMATSIMRKAEAEQVDIDAMM